MKRLSIFVFTFVSLFSAGQLTNGLLVHYDLNGDANDSHVNNLDGTVSGALGANDRGANANSALSFDGIDDYVSLPYSNELKPQFPFTIAFWTKLNESEAGNFYCSEYVDYQYYGFWVGITANDELHVNIGSGGPAGSSSRRSKVASQTMTLGVWHHVVCIVRDFDDMDIFIDCQNAGGFYSGEGGTSMVYGNYSPRLFSSVLQSGLEPAFLNGSMDDLMIWNRELTANEITSFCATNVKEELTIETVEYEIYPNPTNSYISFKQDVSEIASVKIIDDQGRVALEKQDNFEKIDVYELKNGIYFLQVELKSGINKSIKLIKY